MIWFNHALPIPPGLYVHRDTRERAAELIGAFMDEGEKADIYTSVHMRRAQILVVGDGRVGLFSLATSPAQDATEGCPDE